MQELIRKIDAAIRLLVKHDEKEGNSPGLDEALCDLYEARLLAERELLIKQRRR